MKPTYVPILKAKLGEFEALANLKDRTARHIVPWFDVPPLGEKKRATHMKKSEPPVESYLNGVAGGIVNAWHDGSMYLDFPRWATDAQTESGEHVISYLRNRLKALGLQVNPTVDYVRSDDPVYMHALQGMTLGAYERFCLRLTMDADTIDDLADEEYFGDRVAEILDQLELPPTDVEVLIDFGDYSSTSQYVDDLIDHAKTAISITQSLGFERIILAGCSMPPFITGAVKTQNSTGLVLRKEMVAWRALLSENPALGLVFADYGVRSPNSKDESGPSNTNGKIRYTVGKEYFIARGYPLTEGLKGAQNYSLAKIVLTSGHYIDPSFSWGDERILRCSQGEFRGNSKDWIAIDTNHHIEMVTAEVLEFQHRIIPVGGQLV